MVSDGAVGQDLLDGVVAGVGDEDVAGRVHRHPVRVAEPGADGLDGAVGQHLLEGVVAAVGDEDVAGRVHRHPGREAEPGAEGGLDGGRERGVGGVLEPGGGGRTVWVDRAVSVAPDCEIETAAVVVTTGGVRVMNEPAVSIVVPSEFVATARSK